MNIKKVTSSVFVYSLFSLLIIFSLLFYFGGCSLSQQSNREGELTIDSGTDKSWGDISKLLADTFRIDIKSISAVIDFYPETYFADCMVEVKFEMRPGQIRAVIHLDPVVRDTSLLKSVKLNGQPLDISVESDIKILEFEHTTQKTLEFQRNLEEGIEHTLEMSYRLNLTQGYYFFYSKVNDIYGRGNEEVFPTINAPFELAQHNLTFRVHSNYDFRCIGSGHVQESDDVDVQQWILDTEREVASYTVMFLIAPKQDTVLKEQKINGVDVRLMAFVNGASIDQAIIELESWLPELERNLGPLPMPRGLSIFLTSQGGGMEYYGGTISSLTALKHEVFHMYFACSTVNKTYRDTWMDEAITEWYENSVNPSFYAIYPSFESNIVSGRSPIAVGFDGRAYYEGARIMQAVSDNLGGRNEMIGFLSHIHKNYSFSPFTTLDFLDYLKNYSGIDMKNEFKKWLYSGEEIMDLSFVDSYVERKHRLVMTPPPSILKKYNELKRVE